MLGTGRGEMLNFGSLLVDVGEDVPKVFFTLEFFADKMSSLQRTAPSRSTINDQRLGPNFGRQPGCHTALLGVRQ
jgi:hypothetical protein